MSENWMKRKRICDLCNKTAERPIWKRVQCKICIDAEQKRRLIDEWSSHVGYMKGGMGVERAFRTDVTDGVRVGATNASKMVKIDSNESRLYKVGLQLVLIKNTGEDLNC